MKENSSTSEKDDRIAGIADPGTGSDKVCFSHRVSPNGYLAFILLGTFFTGLFLYLGLDLIAVGLFILTWIINPILMVSDRLVFDGESIRRSGVIPLIWVRLSGADLRLRLEDVELVETQALRAVRRGGDVYYRYRTLISGKGVRFTFSSGGESYRGLVHAVFGSLPDEILDTRSVELRDYLRDPKEVQTKVRFAKIPSSDVLEASIRTRDRKSRRPATEKGETGPLEDLADRSQFLRELANELRISGNLVQSLEVFRRALRLSPDDPWLLFEFARCLHSYAGAEKNPRLLRRSLAALRLSEKKCGNDERFLSRLGETYFQFGDWQRAKRVFQRTIETADDSYRSVRGLAELALREGKIAHVIHHFSAAYRLADNDALRRWTNSEAAYFSRLNSDDDYMDLELSRVSMLDRLERHKRSALRVVLLGLPCILFGMVLEQPMIVNLGWTVSCLAILLWTGMHISRNLMSSRLPLERK